MDKQFNIYFADRQFNITGMASTAVPFSLQIFEDRELEEIDTDTVTLDLSIDYSGESGVDSIINIGYYIIYRDENGKDRFFTIINSEKFSTEKLIEVYAEDAGLDLLNTVALPYAADKDYSIAQYIKRFAGNSGFEVGINELEGLSRKLEWTGEDTVTKRLLSICTQFGHAELEYSFEIEGLAVTKKLINVYKKRGGDSGITLRLHEELNEITTSKSIEKLATGLYVTGGTPEGSDNPITLAGYLWDDSRFYTNGAYLLDRKSFQLWNRFGVPTTEPTVSNHLTSSFSFDTLSKSELCNRAITELTKLSEVEVNFTVDIAVLPEGVRIGDTVNIVDIDDELFLNARVLKFEKSRVSRESTAVLGEFLIQRSGISQKVSDLAEKINVMKDGDSSFLWIRYADDDKGNGFSATPIGKSYMSVKQVINQPIPSDNPIDYSGLWVKIQGNDGIPGQSGADGKPTYTWIRYADTVSGTGISDKPANKQYIGFAYNKPTPTPTNTPTDYVWFLAKGNDGKDGADGVAGAAGADGKTTYTWIRYADTSTGVGINNNPTGKPYIGFAYNKSSAVESNAPADYTWSLIQGKEGVAGKPGTDGKPTYTWVKYAKDKNGTGLSDDPNNMTYIGIAVNRPTIVESTIPTDYIWSLFKGEDGMQGVAGKPGSDGKTLYTWIKYADTATGGGMSDSGANKLYIGFAYNKPTAVESTNPADYSWSLIKGANGGQGIQGAPGANGQSTYTWVRYATTIAGTGMVAAPTTATKFIGIAAGMTTPTPSAKPTDYTWSKFVGDNGANGADGKPVFLHTAYANSANGVTGFTIDKNQSVGKKYLGTYSNTNPVQSTNPNSYAWIELAGAFEEKLTEIQNNIDAVAVPLIQSSTPQKGLVNQQWWKTDMTGDVIGFFKWDGGKWAPQTIQQSVLNILELNAVKITGADMQTSKLSASTIENAFEIKQAGLTTKGTLKIENASFLVNYVIVESKITGFISITPDGITFATSDQNGVPIENITLGRGGLLIRDRAGQGTITSTTFYETPWFWLPLAAGASHINSGEELSYRNKYNDLQLRGGVRILANKGAYVTVGVLPAGFRPKMAKRYTIVMSSGFSCLCEIRPTGAIVVQHQQASGAQWFSMDGVSFPIE